MSRELLDEQVNDVEDPGGTVAGVHLREERPAEEIVALAEELGAYLMVVGSRGCGGRRSVLTGSVFDRVIRYACRPVLVVGAGARVADVAGGGLDRISGRHTLNGTLTQPLRTVTSLRHGRGTI
jgi:hypothetical protein